MSVPPVSSTRDGTSRPQRYDWDHEDPPLLLFDALAAEAAQQWPESGVAERFRARREAAAREIAAIDWGSDDADDARRRIDSALCGELYAWLHEEARRGRRRSVLCLSGGGIRSATYALGVIQGLARRQLLRGFDFLSTVSGGGYVGSWLMAFIHRQLPAGRPPTPAEAMAAVTAVEAQIGGAPERQNALAPEPEPVRHLRAFSRYLAPRMGLLSADSWTLVGTYMRNLTLNWLVLLPLLALGLFLPRVRIWLSHHRPADETWWSLPFWVAFAAGVVAIAYIVANRPGLLESGESRFPRPLQSQLWFLNLCLAPLATMVLALAVYWAWVRPGNAPAEFVLFDVPVSAGFAFSAFGATLHFAGWLLSRLWVRSFRIREVLAVVASGALGGLFLWPVAEALPVYDGDHLSPFYAAFAGPLVLWMFLVAATLFVGLASRQMTDADREWLARGGSWMLIAILVGSAVNALVVFGPPLLLAIPLVLGPLGGLSGVATALLGRSGSTASREEDPEQAEQRKGLTARLAELALALAAPVFVVILYAAVALGTTYLVRVFALWLGAHWPRHQANPLDHADLIGTLMHSPLCALILAVLALAFPVFLMGSRVDVNRFSLHGAYRDRLIRAYLGASRLPSTRRPNPFTGFDEADNVQMHALRGNRPLQVLGVTLNLVSGGKLAWQDRKAESFTVSPLHCGSWFLGYRDSARYGHHPGTDRAISLGTALAVSGAAASPNQGYHSSPVVTFLMAFFNVRLGWWLGNPGRFGAGTYDQPGPRFSPRPLISEAFGLTDDQHPYVNLSDGGHFDNMGLYEMVLRRCHLIVLVDGEQDDKYSFEGLGWAISKIRIDFGIPIEFEPPPPMRPFDARTEKAQDPPTPYHALGRVRYSCVDGPGAEDGWIVFVKASLNGSEPVDVANYAKNHPAFPQESTGDQFYSELQFESYRALGSHTVDFMLKDVPEGSGLAEVFAKLGARL
jgi:hypothetical protein